MKRVFFATLGAAMVVSSAVTGLSAFSNAAAQKGGAAPVILTISTDQVIGQSKAGKNASEQVEKYRESVAGELNAEIEQFQKDVETFQKNRELYSEETMKQKATELQLKQRQIPGMEQVMNSVFSNAVQKAQFDILKEAEPIILEIAEKRGATVMLDKSQVLFSASETNVTQEVISKLDKKMKSVEVQRISLADVKKKAEEAAKSQQQKK